MTMTSKTQNLIGLLTGLIDVLERENELLNKPNVQQITDLVEEKQNLFFEYDKQVSQLNGDVSFVGSLSEEAKVELKELSQRFDDVSRENELKLRATLKTSDMIVDHITKAATRSTGASLSAYGGDGNQRSAAARAAPVAINRTL